jgi:transposase
MPSITLRWFEGKIRRLHLRDGLSIREVSRRTGLSRNTVRQWLRQEGVTEPKYPQRERACVVAPWAKHLEAALRTDAHRPVRERRTIKALFEQIQALGYRGSYPRVVVWVRRWREAEAAAPRRAAFVPLAFELGEALGPRLPICQRRIPTRVEAIQASGL